jgi:hypothetical protein
MGLLNHNKILNVTKFTSFHLQQEKFVMFIIHTSKRNEICNINIRSNKGRLAEKLKDKTELKRIQH